MRPVVITFAAPVPDTPNIPVWPASAGEGSDVLHAFHDAGVPASLLTPRFPPAT